jgi:hypothetical protein
VGVLETPDRTWRLEQRSDGLRLYHHGFLVLERATPDQVVAYMLNLGADPEQLAER